MVNPDRRVTMWLFLATTLGYLLTAGGHFYASDDIQKLATLESAWTQGNFAIDEGWAAGVDNKRFAWFPIGSWLLMLPGYALGELVTHVVPRLPEKAAVHFCISMENSILSALVVVFFYQLLRLLGRGAKTAVVVAAFLGLATMVWPYAKTSWSEPADRSPASI